MPLVIAAAVKVREAIDQLHGAGWRMAPRKGARAGRPRSFTQLSGAHAPRDEDHAVCLVEQIGCTELRDRAMVSSWASLARGQ